MLEMKSLYWFLIAACLLNGCFVHQCEGSSGSKNKKKGKVQQASGSQDQLIFAHILFRHGDRNIRVPFPKDEHGDMKKNYPEGPAELTNIGKQQQYELGVYLAERYKNLIGNNGAYHKDIIYVQSTDVDRCLQSVAHNMAGMFPPKENQKWNKKLGQIWHAVPIHTVPEAQDHILAMRKPCPLFSQELNDAFNSKKASFDGNSSYINMLRENSGLNITNVCNVLDLYHTLWVHNEHKLSLPKWAKKEFYPGCLMEKIGMECFLAFVSTEKMLRVKPGYLIKDILDRFSAKKNGTLKPDRSIHVYSAHDTTIIGVLSALKLFEPHYPEYAACLFFELYTSNNGHYVQLYYKRDREVERQPLQALNIPNCGKKCPLDQFYRIFQNIIPSDNYDEECKPRTF
ncbi:lysosomal acid phosphatase-like [Contarinia nasturtii]|uniref:lysosomal acid phosphatase-like n=1 Tax=Contarinia nasturtii TaxID=265458 RepID=UPI0012D398E1|nr:lysosomal acid phosphatase-like [Contarinia nasturtii]